MGLIFPNRGQITRTGPLDFGEDYFHPLHGIYLRMRARWALGKLGRGPFKRMLEIGYGSGILLPELSKRTRLLFGVDRHNLASTVRRNLNVPPSRLLTADAMQLPFRAGSFDAVFMLSTLEFTDVAGTVSEVHRVLQPGGIFLVCSPLENGMSEFLFRILNPDENSCEYYGNRRELLEAAVGGKFGRIVRTTLPNFLPRFALYQSLRAIRR